MIEFRIKEKTRSLNESFRGDWRPRAAAAKRQRTKAMQACPKWPGGPLLVVRLTRVSPGTLDGDAVPAALKHIRDGVASRLKIDDASPLVEWEYHQAKGEAEVVVQMWRAWDDAPPLPVGCPVGRGKAMPKASAFDHAVNKRLRDPDKEEKRPPRPGYGVPRKPRKVSFNDAMDALVPERRAMRAAMQAEETFAPAEPNAWVPTHGGPITPSPVPPCCHCGEPYRPKCFDPDAPGGAVKCRKDVHCYRYDGHDDECRVGNPRVCTT